MPVKTPTQWIAPSGTGYVSSSTNTNIETQSGINLETQSGVDLIIQEQTYSPKFPTSWSLSSKNDTAWRPPSGQGFVINVGAEDIATNSGNLVVTNGGDNLVTNSTYTTPRNPTAWTASGS